MTTNFDAVEAYRDFPFLTLEGQCLFNFEDFFLRFPVQDEFEAAVIDTGETFGPEDFTIINDVLFFNERVKRAIPFMGEEDVFSSVRAWLSGGNS